MEDPAIAEPTDEIDTDVPCYALAHSPLVTGREELDSPRDLDPSLIHSDVLLCAKASDPSFIHLREHLGDHSLIDVDQNGLLGVVLSSNKFQLAIPPLPGIPLPVTIFRDVRLPGHSENVIGPIRAPEFQRGQV